MTLAQATPDAHAFSQFWIILAFLASVASNAITAVVMISNRKQKREISFGFEPANRAECKQHIDGIESRFKRVEEKREEDLRLSAQSRKLVHQDIERIGREVSALTATTASQTAHLQRLDTKIDDVPERVIATLKNTGAI